MSKTYIVSRNGGTVTKAPINDNKIPIYDNESALDAGLSNLADNTLVLLQNSGVYEVYTENGTKKKKQITGNGYGSSVIPTSTTVINNIPIANNSAIKVMFIADISDTNATGGITPLTITYNGISIPVKANKNGALVDVLAKEVQTNIWKYLQAYTTLELVYQSDYDGQGNPAFIISGNPILLSSSDYTIYANGYIEQRYSGSISSQSFVIVNLIITMSNADYYANFSTDTNRDDDYWTGYLTRYTNKVVFSNKTIRNTTTKWCCFICGY